MYLAEELALIEKFPPVQLISVQVLKKNVTGCLAKRIRKRRDMSAHILFQSHPPGLKRIDMDLATAFGLLFLNISTP